MSSKTPNAIVSAFGPTQCATNPPPFFNCYTVQARSALGVAINADFTIAIL